MGARPQLLEFGGFPRIRGGKFKTAGAVEVGKPRLKAS